MDWRLGASPWRLETFGPGLLAAGSLRVRDTPQEGYAGTEDGWGKVFRQFGQWTGIPAATTPLVWTGGTTSLNS